MGADLFDARPDILGDRADEILGWSLREICLGGPEDVLTRTEHAQPAIFALSYALWEALSSAGIHPAGSAGHSLGEYTALTATGALDFDTALRVVSERGRAMASAADLEPSGMAALLGADEPTAESISKQRREQGGRLSVANINAPGQVVVAGGSEDLDWLVANTRDLGVRRVVPLKVAGGFHSPFMAPAAEDVEEALTGVAAGELQFPVWSNTTARPHNGDDLVELLVRQVVTPVRFSESLAAMGERGIDTFVHVGPGDVTAGMARRSVPGCEVLVVSDLASIPDVVRAIGSIAESDE
jgi:[acyl-carrier-protein] S-malonyltransferase